MDLVPEGKRQSLFEKRKAQLQSKAGNFTIISFPSRILEIPLYKAWTVSYLKKRLN